MTNSPSLPLYNGPSAGIAVVMIMKSRESSKAPSALRKAAIQPSLDDMVAGKGMTTAKPVTLKLERFDVLGNGL